MVALVIAEHDNGSLKGSTHHTVTAAAQCGGEVHVLVAGSNCGAAAEAAAQIAGVSKVLVADAPYFADGLAENVAEQILAVAGSYSHILAPATAYGKNILPRVAARLDVAQISEITKVDSPDTFERPCAAPVSMPLPPPVVRPLSKPWLPRRTSASRLSSAANWPSQAVRN
jgi:electron transfer flavoprotein alpha subunit